MIDPTADNAAFRFVQRIPDTQLGLRLMHCLAYANLGRTPSNITIERAAIHGKTGHSIPITIARPKAERDGLPILLHFHGGGYAIGAPRQDIGLFSRLIDAAPCIIIAPHYRRSFQARYPAALEDCYDVLCWVRDNAVQLGGRADQIMVMGESAGGGLAAAICIAARDRGDVNIAAQFPLYAMLDNRTTSTNLALNDLSWTPGKNKLAWDLYVGPEDKDMPATAVPARTDNLAKLPPAIGFVGSCDLFMQENIAYFTALETAGVQTNFKLIDGAYHGVEVFAPDSNSGRIAMDYLLTMFEKSVKSHFAPQKEKQMTQKARS
ncbi:alpha/beta hydrolase [Maritalea porphyrae]|uniref:Esterase LipW n=1 Tax=Maritalea porphyrae TaxID=880732 RepID=A0ABQ5UNH9_9HYPH|nr:alpha/beta hydrolase [Maritalea porphyrae]GLQ16390.1 putative esterase LipW [Maritalea porphyrae]